MTAGVLLDSVRTTVPCSIEQVDLVGFARLVERHVDQIPPGTAIACAANPGDGQITLRHSGCP